MHAERAVRAIPTPDAIDSRGLNPAFAGLIERYATDPRFIGDETERDGLMSMLTGVGDFFAASGLPPGVKSLILAGSYSANYPDAPPVTGDVPEYGPFHMRRRGGSDMDLLFLHGNPLAWGRSPLNSRIYRAIDAFLDDWAATLGKGQLRQYFHVSSEPLALGYAALPRYARFMVRTGTPIIWHTPFRQCGIDREHPPRNEKSDHDAIIDMMGM